MSDWFGILLLSYLLFPHTTSFHLLSPILHKQETVAISCVATWSQCDPCANEVALLINGRFSLGSEGRERPGKSSGHGNVWDGK